MTEFVIPAKRKRVDNEDKDCSCGRLPHTFKNRLSNQKQNWDSLESDWKQM